jgi:protein-disulfide isomerase
MRSKFETAATSLLVVAALTVAGTSAHREFSRTGRTVIEARSTSPPTYVANWKELLPDGIRMGDADAPIKIVEFADFECPACRAFHSTMTAIRSRYGRSLAVHYLHFPLPYHRFARPAARAAECAASRGKFESFHDLLFAKQDSLGLKSWASFATDAGVRDTTGFRDCVADTARMERVERGLALGSRFDVNATPTVIINGWRFATIPRDSLALIQILSRISAGLAPLGDRSPSGSTGGR